MTTRENQRAYSSKATVNQGELPDLFVTPKGDRATCPKEWPSCAGAWRDMILDVEYGGLPPSPERFEMEPLCHNRAKRLPGTPNNWSYRVHCSGSGFHFTFCIRIVFPSTDGLFPAIVTGDGCWWHISDDIVRNVLDSGCALVVFNRTEMAEDLGYPGVPDKHKRSGGLYDIYPGMTFGALSAWAWGYHRCVDALHLLPFIDKDHIAVTGHSRGGKTALLAGATDNRIALVNDNASGAGGGATFRYVGDGGETINIVDVFPSWFGPDLRNYRGREAELPFDQHCLLASIAPRPLLQTYALDDRWSNPEGMVQCAHAAKEAYDFLGMPENIAFHLRQGGHAHNREDWDVLLDFIAWKWRGKDPGASYNSHPYTHLPRSCSWRSPVIEKIGQPASSKKDV